ncbi:hypothetical protein [Mycobacterium leprae]|uniref:hypothetical protein n=1 Tax=Mycobacterium leprae TaxID=1769 RepID=UPI000304BD0F|nr:hypothetical protein [Mycobacterium leprae]
MDRSINSASRPEYPDTAFSFAGAQAGITDAEGTPVGGAADAEFHSASCAHAD